MAVDRATVVDKNFKEHVASLHQGFRKSSSLDSPVRAQSRLTARQAMELFESQISSRQVDFAARWLRKQNEGFYTIGSSGHEGNVAVAAALRPTDPAFLHYRSGGFFLQRARQVPGQTPLMDILLGMAASADEPIAGGRHKVFGSLALQVPPQTSTIASHLPKAVGAAFAMDRRSSLGLSTEVVPSDAVVACTFGDASSNHSTAAGAINAACWTSFQHLPLPLLFVCEDNDIGISVKTPVGWIESNYRHRPGLQYFQANGLELSHAYEVATQAVEYVRKHRKPAFLHLKTVRMLGHAGSDVEAGYRTLAEIEDTESKDPLLSSARLLVEEGWMTPDEVLALYEEIHQRVFALVAEVITRPKLTTAKEVMAPLAPFDANAVESEATRAAGQQERQDFWGKKLPEEEGKKHLAILLNRGLGDLMVKYPESMIFGEDVARKGGVYFVTGDLWRKAGLSRVFNTLLDEQTILGVALGAAQLGALPIPEIQYLAYLHNAIDQIRGEAASLQFFSQKQFSNPMVCRIASYAYQKGFGGHFHNDNSITALRDIPGLLIASPSNGRDAVGMLRTCMAAGRVNGRISVFLEPIALYMTRDLYERGDRLWSFEYPAQEWAVPAGVGRVYGEGEDLTFVSWANGVPMSLRVARKLEKEHGIRSRVLDLRWIAPLPVEDLRREAGVTGRVLVVDETRQSGGVSEALFTALVEGGYKGEMRRVTGKDTFIPLGDAANRVLVQEEDIEAEALSLWEATR